MQILDFTKEWLPQAQRLAEENYAEARAVIPVLPETALPPLDHFAENGMGAAAVENGVLLGFLGGFLPFRPVYCTPDTAGVWSPLHAHGVQKENREKIWQQLVQAAGEKWAKAGAASHSITLYTQDLDAQKALYFYGFGARCTDLMRLLTEIPAQDHPGIRFAELSAENAPLLRPLRHALVDHLGKSPCFMKHDETGTTDFLNRREADPPRMFAAFCGDLPVAYMELDDEGENFASCVPGTGNICGAYCLPEYRGQGIAQALLNFVIRTLRQEGDARLGVDCETINPTAVHFWRKYFTPYTTSVVRRIDENAVCF